MWTSTVVLYGDVKKEKSVRPSGANVLQTDRWGHDALTESKLHGHKEVEHYISKVISELEASHLETAAKE